MIDRRWVSVIVLLVGILPVMAHNPRVEDHDWGDFDQPYVIAEGSVSYAFFGYLSSPQDRDVFRITFADEQPTFKIDDFVPVCGDHYTDFVLDYVLLGENVETPEALKDLELPFELPANTGVLFASAAERTLSGEDTETERPFSFEFHTQRNYYDTPEYSFELPDAGSYWLVLYNAEGKVGDYLLATGYEETFFSLQEEEPPTTQMREEGYWPHRDCERAVSDASAIIHVKPETLPQATLTLTATPRKR